MNTSFVGSNHFISLEVAKAMTATYRSQREGILKVEFQGKNILPISETFDRAAIDSVLNQPGCTGLRIYYGMSDDLNVHAIVVGVNANNEDILPLASSASTSIDTTTSTDGGGILEDGLRCPPECPTSPLNA